MAFDEMGVAYYIGLQSIYIYIHLRLPRHLHWSPSHPTHHFDTLSQLPHHPRCTRYPLVCKSLIYQVAVATTGRCRYDIYMRWVVGLGVGGLVFPTKPATSISISGISIPNSTSTTHNGLSIGGRGYIIHVSYRVRFVWLRILSPQPSAIFACTHANVRRRVAAEGQIADES